MLQNSIQLLKKFTNSLSFKISFYTGLIMFFALLAFAYHSITNQEQHAINRVIQSALRDSEVIKAAVREGMMTNDRGVITEIIKSIGAQAGFKDINIFDNQGTLHYASHPVTEEVFSKLKYDPLLRDVAADTSVKHRISEDGMRLTLVSPILNMESCSSAACHSHPQDQKMLGALAIKIPLDDLRQEILGNAKKTIIFAFLLFLFISTIIGLAVIFLINPSIRRLQEEAARLARGEYQPNTVTTGSDEMAELSRSFEEMGRMVNERTTRLAEGRRMYKSLFEEVPCYLTVVNSDYRIVRANRSFKDQFGDIIGKHCFLGYKQRDSKCEFCPVEKTFADGLSHQSEETWRVGSEDAHVIVKTAPIFDDEGVMTEVLEMSLDVTRLKRLQMELQKKQEEYKYLFENVPCYITLVDKDYNIIQSNKMFQEHFAGKAGTKCYAIYKNADRKCGNCPVEKTFIDGLSHESEEIWRRNGEETHIIVNTAPVTSENGEIRAVMEISTNITEVKKLQNELMILGETIAGMSHTIKNILSGLQGGVYVVDSGLQRGREDRVREGWDIVKRNVEKVSDLVHEILYASKGREPEYTECDPAQILNDVCDLYEERLRAEEITLIKDFESQMKLGMLDGPQIHNAVANLISNALHASRESLNRPRQIRVSGRVEQDELRITVSDNGIGMTEEIREKLFKKFYSTKGSKGTGLGLVITRKIVHEHGGSISVESEHGKGTSFCIRIPFNKSKPHRSANSVLVTGR
ncbi:MAG: ATP-binding protein [Desulfomonilaceae bacterium]